MYTDATGKNIRLVYNIINYWKYNIIKKYTYIYTLNPEYSYENISGVWIY